MHSGQRVQGGHGGVASDARSSVFGDSPVSLMAYHHHLALYWLSGSPAAGLVARHLIVAMPTMPWAREEKHDRDIDDQAPWDLAALELEEAAECLHSDLGQDACEAAQKMRWGGWGACPQHVRRLECSTQSWSHWNQLDRVLILYWQHAGGLRCIGDFNTDHLMGIQIHLDKIGTIAVEGEGGAGATEAAGGQGGEKMKEDAGDSRGHIYQQMKIEHPRDLRPTTYSGPLRGVMLLHHNLDITPPKRPSRDLCRRCSHPGSPAFSTMSVPSPPPPAMRASLPGASTGTFTPRHHSSSSSSGSVYDDFVTSISAPSHKQVFDHGSLYPPGMLLESSTGAGPIRRHRSMTPSLVHNGEPIRRPLTSNSNSGEFAGVLGASPSSRGYHPYAYGSAAGSRAGSAHSSPSYNSIPLAPDYGGASVAAVRFRS
ncbi:hypothetical protein FB451DRAFT_1375962, partial [Mycena latifolia]